MIGIYHNHECLQFYFHENIFSREICEIFMSQNYLLYGMVHGKICTHKALDILQTNVQ